MCASLPTAMFDCVLGSVGCNVGVSLQDDGFHSLTTLGPLGMRNVCVDRPQTRQLAAWREGGPRTVETPCQGWSIAAFPPTPSQLGDGRTPSGTFATMVRSTL